MKLSLARACLLSLCVVSASPALAQMVAPLPSQPDTSDPAALLSENLKALARDPYNVDALVQAGQGALAIGDPNAAFGFFARAEELSPQSWRAKSGLASSLTMLEKSREALRVFDEAMALGAPEQEVVADRGLAHDLDGDGKKAQRDYLTALRLRPTDEVTRRLALSLGIGGEKDAALARLDPLVRRNDQGAWRARAFILAMNGDAAGAERIVRMVAPAETASSMVGFMQRLSGLNASAKAHAVHFGTLPASGSSAPSLLVEDSFRPLDPGAAVKLAVAEPERRSAATPSDSSASPDARRQSRNGRDGQLAVLAARGRSAATIAPSGMAAPMALENTISTSSTAPSAATVTAMPMGDAPAARFEVPPAPSRASGSIVTNKAGVSVPTLAVPAKPLSSVVISAPTPQPAIAVASPPVVQASNLPASTATQMQLPEATTGQVFSSLPAQNGTAAPAVPTPAPIAAAEPAPAATQVAEATPAQPSPAEPMPAPPPAAPAANTRLTLGDIVNTLPLEQESAPIALPDAAKLKALRLAAQKKAAAEEKARAEKAEQDRKAAEEAAKARRNPARLWVQIATGRNTAGLPGTWRSLKSKAPKALGDEKPWSVSYLQTNRLLVGPIKSSKAARELVQDLAKEGVKAMVFNSEAGQEIERVDN